VNSIAFFTHYSIHSLYKSLYGFINSPDICCYLCSDLRIVEFVFPPYYVGQLRQYRRHYCYLFLHVYGCSYSFLNCVKWKHLCVLRLIVICHQIIAPNPTILTVYCFWRDDFINDMRQTLIIPLIVHYLALHFAAFPRFHVNLHQLMSVMCWEQ
jgi:hypothetical protein